MATGQDLNVIGADYLGAYQNLERIAQGFADNAQVVEDVQDALGHPGLAGEFKTFSDSWRLKREAMQKDFETLAKDIKAQYDTWDKLDHDLAGGGSGQSGTPNAAPDNGGADTPGAGSSNSDPSGASGGGTSAGSGGGAAPLPAASGGGGAASTAASSTDPGTAAAQPGATLTGGQAPVVQDGSSPAGSDTSTLPAAAAMTGAGVLGAIYSIWKGIQEGKNVPAAAGDIDEGLSVRDRIERELTEMKGVQESGYDIQLVADPKDPDDIMAILRGQDGDTLTLSLDDADPDGQVADPAVGAPDPAYALLGPEQATDPGQPGTGLPPAGGASAAGADPAPAAPPLSPTAQPGAAPAGDTASTGAGPLFSTHASVLSDAAGVPAAGVSDAGTAAPAQASAQAGAVGVGAMGMGAMGAQHLMSGASSGPAASRTRAEHLKPPEPPARDQSESEERK